MDYTAGCKYSWYVLPSVHNFTTNQDVSGGMTPRIPRGLFTDTSEHRPSIRFFLLFSIFSFWLRAVELTYVSF